jgi:uncharacterized protein (DUF1697 family)
MTVVISLLRAINVSGKNLLPMSELKAIYGTIGLDRTETLLQSGNAVSVLPKAPKLSTLAARIEAAIEARMGFRPRVLLRSLPELRELAEKNPFPAQARSTPEKLVVHFLDRAPAKTALKALGAVHVGPEEFALGTCELYAYFPHGQGKSKLTAARLEQGLGSTGTGRNWNTLLKLIAMAEKLELKKP